MDNLVVTKSFRFGVRIVNLCKELRSRKTEYVLIQQLLKSGTSIGANIAESQQAQSRADFVSKLSISLKEAVETDYWLRLLNATAYLSETEASSLRQDCHELIKLLTSILKSSKSEASK